ncbi:alcohol dehydrogenase [Mycena latifolia]|nr:alcohol dehydrogenase [Mycena latifolia]
MRERMRDPKVPSYTTTAIVGAQKEGINVEDHMIGMTLFEAYTGETIFVSSGASGVGRMELIASAGTDDKIDYMKSLGADVAFNYNTTLVLNVLREHQPLHLYWDNVGGSTLEAAIDHLTVHSRIIICGSSYEYNVAYNDRYGMKKRLQVQDFLVADLAVKMAPRFFAEVPALVAQGKLRCRENITKDIEHGPAAFADMLKQGTGVRKPLLVVAEE